ncbi:MAG: hypothetical protein HY855_03450 [Burkholderiales bacterium]|nr:hypothetical protein [Burkholderiales bacterium]
MPKATATVNMRKEEERWKVESDLRTLMEAEAIEKDPKRFAAAKALAKERLLELASVASESD